MGEENQEKKSCCQKLTKFESTVVVCLILITFFIGTIWLKMLMYCPAMTGGGKICPISGN